MPADPNPPPPAPDRGPRYLVLLAITVLSATALGLLASVAVGAVLTFLPPIVGVSLGSLFGFVLPLFLALRAAAALKRRGRGTLIRRVVTLSLITLTQLAVLGAAVDFADKGTGELAATGAGFLGTFGGVPVLSGLLEEHARRNNVPLPGSGGVKSAPDAGPVGAGGVPDAGPAKATPAPPLSARTPGGAPVRTLAVADTLQSGASGVFIVQFASGGAASPRHVDLSAHAKLGTVTAISSADDQSTALVLGGEHVVVVRGAKPAEHIKVMSRGAILQKTHEVQHVRDIAVGPGGDLLAVIEATLLATSAVPATGDLVQVLAHLPKTGGAVQVVRKEGDAVPNAEDQSIARAFTLHARRGDGRVLLNESFREGPDEVAPQMVGEQYTMNPQRVVALRADRPKVQQEVVRTGLAPSGIADRSLQAFADAVPLPDGRVVFDGNFVENGPTGWLFSWRAGGAGVQALAPDRFIAGGAAFAPFSPRTPQLDVEPDGSFVFVKDGDVVWSRLQSPTEAQRGLKGVVASVAGEARGRVARVDRVWIGTGGAWVMALAAVDGLGDALLLASAQDLKTGVAEVILAVGVPVSMAPPAAPAPAAPAPPAPAKGAPPSPAPPPAPPPAPAGPPPLVPASLKHPVREELLWTPAAAVVVPVAPVDAGP